MPKKKFLDSVYALKSSGESKSLYADWSESYDAEVDNEGYATPGRIAALMSQSFANDISILDYGCGTGLAGVALSKAGFLNITGWDITPEMVELARAKKVYNALEVVAADDDLPDQAGMYDVIVACGVIGSGAAPPVVFDQIMNALKPGGHFCFSFNDHTLEDHSYTSKVAEWVDCGAARLLAKDYGDHLPGRGIKAMIYMLQKG